MSNARRRLWGHSESDLSPEQPGERIADRLSEYTSPSESRSTDPAERPPDPDQEVGERQETSPRAGTATDPAAVGNEVAAVLQSAHEAAATIRRSAGEEAERRREELEAEIAAEIEERRRDADADRADAQRLRADAETYATETRSAADAYAEQRRAEAERESAAIIAEVQSRFEAADAEAERRVREAEEGARARVDILSAEAERYEERLDNIFIVFREMSSQLEELVGGRETAGRQSPGDEGLDDALRPDPSASHVA